MTERTAYLVLGMHRSGTSATTQLLALAGAQLPTNVMPGDEHNAKGYFEPWKIAMLNGERLRAATSAWDDPFAFPYRPLDAEGETLWRERALAVFREEFPDAPYPLLKDPRITVLMPLWREVLTAAGVGARCVIPVRGPLAVAGSLARRNGYPAARSVLVWTSYMLAAEAYSRDLPRAFVGYDALLTDWRREAAALEAAHGAPLPALTPEAATAIDGFLTADLRHNADDDGLAGLGWAGALCAPVWAWFQAAAAGATPDIAPLERAAAELARRQAEIGVLVSPLARDHDAARAALLDTRQQLEFETFQRGEREAEVAVLAARVAALETEISAAAAALGAFPDL